jgi:hypothetical protein
MDKIIETINQILEKMKVKSELVEPKIMEHLKNIEVVLGEKFTKQEELKNEITKNRPSINGVAKESKIARQTIYNNDLLKAFIELRIENYNELDLVKRNDKLSEEIRELKKKIKKMEERDVQLELMRRKISLVEKELKQLKADKNESEQKYINLKLKMESKEKTAYKAEVIPIK